MRKIAILTRWYRASATRPQRIVAIMPSGMRATTTSLCDTEANHRMAARTLMDRAFTTYYPVLLVSAQSKLGWVHVVEVR